MTEDQEMVQPASQGRDAGNIPVPSDISAAGLPVPTSGTGRKEEPAPSANVHEKPAAEGQARFASETHEYIREYIRLADQKATFFFTGGTALLAFLYKNGISSMWLKPLMTWNILDTIAFLSMASLSVAAFLSLLVVIPRTPGSRRGYIFWEAIAEYETNRQYADELSTLSPATLFQAKAEHCYDLACVCRRKYRVLRWALRIGAVGLAGALLLFLTVVHTSP